MKKILVSVQNALLAEAIIMALKKQGQFRPDRVSPNRSEEIVPTCLDINAEILLMEVSYLPALSLDRRLTICNQIRHKLPGCKLVLLCDEDASPETAARVKQAKQLGQIDAFFYASVTESYLTAALDAL